MRQSRSNYAALSFKWCAQYPADVLPGPASIDFITVCCQIQFFHEPLLYSPVFFITNVLEIIKTFSEIGQRIPLRSKIFETPALFSVLDQQYRQYIKEKRKMLNISSINDIRDTANLTMTKLTKNSMPELAV